jgi:hypothetical protein
VPPASAFLATVPLSAIIIRDNKEFFNRQKKKSFSARKRKIDAAAGAALGRAAPGDCEDDVGPNDHLHFP